MKQRRLIMLALSVLAAARFASWADAGAAEVKAGETNREPNFQEVYRLIRSNLNGVSEADLDRAAVSGLLSQFQTRVILETNAPSSKVSQPSLISKTELFDESYACLRVSQVGPGLAKQVMETRQQLQSKKKVGGLILDLRFSDGQDYAAATEVADLFLTNELPLLKLGEAVSRSTAKTNALDRPVAVLVNRQTAGAAEALAAILRQTDAGLLIGTPTAGQAHQFREFTLSNGQRLKIASGTIRLGNGTALSEKGLNPDIRVEVSPQDERAYFSDPYKVIPQLLAEALRTNGTETGAGLSGTNRAPRRRINETDLVRMRREGNDLDAEPPSAPNHPPAKPVVSDPALARAIDFLKGLALVQSRR